MTDQEELLNKFDQILNKFAEQSTIMTDLQKSLEEINSRVAKVEATQQESFNARLDALANLSTPTGKHNDADVQLSDSRLDPAEKPIRESTEPGIPPASSTHIQHDVQSSNVRVLLATSKDRLPGDKFSSSRFDGADAAEMCAESNLTEHGQTNPFGQLQRIKVQPREFDGKTPWQSYRLHFETVARVNGWMNNIKALYLAPYLRGTALAFFETLQPDVRDDYTRLDEALKQRFGNEYEQSTAHSELRGRLQKPKESLNELATDIQRLVYLAFPDCPEPAKDRIALAQFIDGIFDLELQQRVRDSAPDTLEKALSTAVRAEASRVATRLSRRQIRAAEVRISDGESCNQTPLPENENRAA